MPEPVPLPEEPDDADDLEQAVLRRFQAGPHHRRVGLADRCPPWCPVVPVAVSPPGAMAATCGPWSRPETACHRAPSASPANRNSRYERPWAVSDG